jgi:hypothetical protein
MANQKTVRILGYMKTVDMDPILEVYDKFKHLDACLSDPGWMEDSSLPYKILGELWQAIKSYAEAHK